ncbi:hypothetical protein PHAVU_004G042700 [Phaseolus vulgaris]|uniref:Pollen Ole e 1 allergen and extensin family protein n=1 Tax=Phaseolus vulgaris TaxID=3885 RepID=V7BZN8_PHAVU|nr:hypothetical protein PHAVU_004G042700g [Phaseolus vulgaris]ESW23387.1 hypothetical protein PHAVU_004G042700g [Phaseolus vulgaris]
MCCVSEVQDNKFSSAVVVGGTVFCDTCSQHDFNPKTHFISGAKVGVECKVGHSIPSFKKEVVTDKYGEFKVKLPFKVRRHAKTIKGCTFKLISSSEPHCDVPALSTSSSVSLIATKQGEHIFSAGFFSFKPIRKPSFCNQKQSVPNPSPSDKNSVVDTFFPPYPWLPFPNPLLPPPNFPPNPLLPFPNFPPNPLLPFPNFPPNPLLPPLQPSPPILPPSPLPPPLSPYPVQPPPTPLPPSPLPPPLTPNPVQPPPTPLPPHSSHL